VVVAGAADAALTGGAADGAGEIVGDGFGRTGAVVRGDADVLSVAMGFATGGSTLGLLAGRSNSVRLVSVFVHAMPAQHRSVANAT
jgi:hypothetical protein